MKKIIMSMSIALGFVVLSSALACAQGTVIGTQDFDAQTSFSFGFAFSDAGAPTTTAGTTGGGNNSANAFGVTADFSSIAGSTFAGFGGGFGVFGANLLSNAPTSIADFNIGFDAKVDGVTDTTTPIDSVIEITFRYPDTVADGDDGGGNDFADDIFRVDVPFQIAATNGVYQSLALNLGSGTVVTSPGATPENSLLSFSDFVNGDPAIAGRDFSLVNELLLNFVVVDGLQFGEDADNTLMIDNVVFQQVEAVPEPSALILLCSVGALGFIRRRR